MNDILKNKTIIVTGGAGLIGSEIVKTVLFSGGNVIIADNNIESANNLVSSLPKEHNRHLLVVNTDITNKESISKMINTAINHFPNDLYGLVNNAYPKTHDFNKPFFEVEYETFCKNLNMHLGGYFLMSQMFSKHLIQNKLNGLILNISSIYGVIAPKFSIYEGTKLTTGPEYPCIKSAIIHLTKYMAQLLKKNGIRINCISPGGIFANQPESFLKAYHEESGLKGILNPDDINSTIAYLLNPASAFVTGQNIVVDDGFGL